MKTDTKEFIISCYKALAMTIISAIFFIGFGTEYASLTNISRTLALTLFTYGISYFLFSNIYGSLKIGEFKSKQVIYSTALTILFTDIIAYMILMIMQTNPNNIWANQSFTLENLHILGLVMIVQLILIFFSSYNGNYFFFKLFDPQSTLIVYDQDYLEDHKIEDFLKRYKKQYIVETPIEIRNNDLYSKIMTSDFVVFYEMDSEVRKKLVELCYVENINFSFIPSVVDIVEMSGIHATYGDKPIIEVQASKLTFNQRVAKRCLDIAISLTGIIFTLPLWIIFIIAIKLDDGGPIFFSHVRKTIHGKELKVLKFRSMKVNSPNISAVEDDDRITKVGKILRKIRMDELPQLLNILLGDMSLVGPRPEMIENINTYEEEMPEFRYRLKVKAGLTGIAQIEGKYNTSPKDKLIMDLIYIENYSIWLDIKLLFKTFVIFFKKDSTEGF